MSRLAVAGRKRCFCASLAELGDHRADHVGVEAERRRHAGLLHLVLLDIELHRRPVLPAPLLSASAARRARARSGSAAPRPALRAARARRAGRARGSRRGSRVWKNARIRSRNAFPRGEAQVHGRSVFASKRVRRSRPRDRSSAGIRVKPVLAISNSPAAPWPPPMHMVTTTRLAPRRLPSISAWPSHARAAHAVGVADRDRAAIDVQPVVRQAEPVAAVQHLARERLVQLPQVDVVHRQPMPLQQPRHRVDRARCPSRPARSRRPPGRGTRPSAAMPAPRRLLVRHHHAGAGAVAELARIAGGDELVLAAHRLQLGQPLQRRLGPVALVLAQRDLLAPDLVARLVSITALVVGSGTISCVEPPGLLPGGGAALALQRILVLPLAADAVAARRRCRPSRSSACRSAGMCSLEPGVAVVVPVQRRSAPG